MSYRYLVLFAALFLVTACSENVEDPGVVTSQYDTVTTTGPDDGFDNGAGVNAGIGNVNGQGISGSSQDFVANIGDRVFFGYDSSDLTGEARATLERQANWLNQYSNLSVTIEGHADERGTREYNLALGERRANAVRNYLTALGVSPSRVAVISYGKERPVVFGSDTQSWSENRRATTAIN